MKHQYPKKLAIRTPKADGDLVRSAVTGEVDWSSDANYQARYTGFGRVLSSASREYLAAAQLFESLTLAIAVPSCSETRGVTGRDRIQFEGSRWLEVLGAHDRDERLDEVIIFCAEKRV